MAGWRVGKEKRTAPRPPPPPPPPTIVRFRRGLSLDHGLHHHLQGDTCFNKRTCPWTDSFLCLVPLCCGSFGQNKTRAIGVVFLNSSYPAHVFLHRYCRSSKVFLRTFALCPSILFCPTRLWMIRSNVYPVPSTRSSSREVRIRVPFFSVVYFSRGPLPTKKETVKVGTQLGDLVYVQTTDHNGDLSPTPPFA